MGFQILSLIWSILQFTKKWSVDITPKRPLASFTVRPLIATPGHHFSQNTISSELLSNLYFRTPTKGENNYTNFFSFIHFNDLIIVISIATIIEVNRFFFLFYPFEKMCCKNHQRLCFFLLIFTLSTLINYNCVL